MSVKVGLKYIEPWKESMEEAIVAYEKEETEKGQIVFYGPSYFTRWSTRFGMKPMREVLLGKSGKPCVINRGFGSSSAEHQLYYYPRAVRPLEPSVLVYSFQANGPSFGYSAEESWELAQRVIAYAKTDFPDIKLYLCSHTPSRDATPQQKNEAKKFDSWVRNFTTLVDNCKFIDISSCEPLATRKDIFVEDGVHYNQIGYDLFGEFFKKKLAEELAKF